MDNNIHRILIDNTYELETIQVSINIPWCIYTIELLHNNLKMNYRRQHG